MKYRIGNDLSEKISAFIVCNVEDEKLNLPMEQHVQKLNWKI